METKRSKRVIRSWILKTDIAEDFFFGQQYSFADWRTRCEVASPFITLEIRRISNLLVFNVQNKQDISTIWAQLPL